jgi:plasmid stability protein
MANLTINVDEEVLKRARIRALEENTSVNAVLGEYLRGYARLDEVRRDRLAALDRLLEVADRYPIDRGKRRWNRDVLHER